MAQATEIRSDFGYEDISDEYSQFQADISPTNLKGVKHLKLVVDRPFRNGYELSMWLHACVSKLGQDVDNKDLFPKDLFPEEDSQG